KKKMYLLDKIKNGTLVLIGYLLSPLPLLRGDLSLI
ncbi:hypothetical protein NIES298_46610, partial [Microcystis aeruginosa NIES-298]